MKKLKNLRQERIYKVYSPPGIHVGFVKSTSEKDAKIIARHKYNLTEKIVVSTIEDEDSSLDYRGFTERFIGSNFKI